MKKSASKPFLHPLDWGLYLLPPRIRLMMEEVISSPRSRSAGVGMETAEELLKRGWIKVVEKRNPPSETTYEITDEGSYALRMDDDMRVEGKQKVFDREANMRAPG